MVNVICANGRVQTLVMGTYSELPVLLQIFGRSVARHLQQPKNEQDRIAPVLRDTMYIGNFLN
jgi:hypothetical protein